MSKAILTTAIAGLPATLRQEIEGYVSTVIESARDIFREAETPFASNLLNDLVFYAGLRRLWSLVNTRYWLVDRSLALMERSRVRGIVAGRRTFERRSGDVVSLRSVRDALEALIREHGLEAIIFSGSLASMLHLLKDRKR